MAWKKLNEYAKIWEKGKILTGKLRKEN